MRKYAYILFLCLNFCTSQEHKINGISFVASNSITTQVEVDAVMETNANWITLMPFAFVKHVGDSTIVFNSKRQWIGERKEGIEKATAVFKNNNIKVMLKPQIWIPKGFTGHIDMQTEAEWLAFEKKYEEFILFYATVAESENIELFCIGTELNSFVIKRSDFWHELIKKIKKIYKGKLTYAENWDTYQTVSFYDELDFIGVDAYFPLTDLKNPSVSEIEKGWKSTKTDLENFSKKLDKKILFTEFGYQSKEFTTQEPWDYSKHRVVNTEAQSNALQALFNQFWEEDWFAGGFLWKWFVDTEYLNPETDTDYTVQKKPALEIVKKAYKKMR